MKDREEMTDTIELLKKGIVIQDTKEGVKIDYIKK